jgi:hypothetical protein
MRYHLWLYGGLCSRVFPRLLLLLMSRPGGEEVGRRPGEAKQVVVAGKGDEHLLLLPRRHLRLIHQSTAGWIPPRTLRSTSLSWRRRLHPPAQLGVRERTSQLRGRLVPRGRWTLLMRRRWLRVPPCTSVVVHGSCPHR